MPEGTRFQVLAPVVRGRKGEYVDLFADLQAKGFARVRVDGSRVSADRAAEAEEAGEARHRGGRRPAGRPARPASADHRLGRDRRSRLAGGVVVLDFVDLAEDDPTASGRTPRRWPARTATRWPSTSSSRGRSRSTRRSAPARTCTASAPARRSTRSWSSPTRAGRWARARSRRGPAGSEREYFTRLLQRLAADAAASASDTPWDELPAAAQEAVLHGIGEAGARQLPEPVRPAAGRTTSRTRACVPWLERRTPRPSPTARAEQYEGYMREVPCPACGGARLKPESPGRRPSAAARIAEVVGAVGRRARAGCLDGLALTERGAADRRAGAARRSRPGWASCSTSGWTTCRWTGRRRRCPAARRSGSGWPPRSARGLVGVLYVLDEPSIGLHQRDNQRLIEHAERLRDLGNTLIVVEHDEDTIRAADWVVDIGPGRRRARRPDRRRPARSTSCSATPRVDHRRSTCPGARQIAVPPARRPRDRQRELVVEGARENNLQGHRRRVPAGHASSAVTGVSRVGQVDRWSTTSCTRRWPADLNGARHACPGGTRRVDGRGAARQGRRRRPVADRPDAAVQPGDLHRRVRPHPRAVRADARGEGARLPAGPVLASTSRAAAARRARATARSRSR